MFSRGEAKHKTAFLGSRVFLQVLLSQYFQKCETQMICKISVDKTAASFTARRTNSCLDLFTTDKFIIIIANLQNKCEHSGDHGKFIGCLTHHDSLELTNSISRNVWQIYKKNALYKYAKKISKGYYCRHKDCPQGKTQENTHSSFCLATCGGSRKIYRIRLWMPRLSLSWWYS